MNTTITDPPAGWYISISPVFVISLHVFQLLVGLPLNSIVLLFSGNEGMEAADVFTLNQAVTEITLVVVGPFHSLCSVSSELCFLKPLGFMVGLSMCSQGLFQCFVCLERYIAVVHPLVFLRFKRIRYRTTCSIFGWTVALTFAVTCLLMFPNVPYNIFAALYVFILGLNVFCCVSILKKLKHPGPGHRERGEKEMNSFKMKAFQVVCMNLMVFLIKVTPIAVSMMFQHNLSGHDFSLAIVIGHTFSVIAGFVQPIFVLHKAGKFHSLCSTGPQLCFFKPTGFMLGLSVSSRAVFQCLVCLERYLAVVHPLIFLRFKPIRYRIECCIVVWIVALAFAITCMLTFPDMPYHIYGALYVVILALNVFCCVSILKKLRHPGPGESDRREREMNSFKKKAFRVVCMNLLTFLIQIFPITISFGLWDELSMHEFSTAIVISLTFSISGGIVQSIFVLHKTGKLSLMRDHCLS